MYLRNDVDVKPFATISEVLGKHHDVKRLIDNPDQVLRKKRIRNSELQKLLYDTHISSVVQSRLATVLNMKHKIVFKKESEHIEYLFKKIIEKIDFFDLMNDLLHYWFYGYRVNETIWQYQTIKDKDFTSYRMPCVIDVPDRPNDWIQFTQDGRPKLQSYLKYDGKFLPPEKFLIARHKPSYLNPYGEAVGSKMWSWYVIKVVAVKAYQEFIDNYGLANIAAEPEDLDAVDQTLVQELYDQLNKLKRGEPIVPSLPLKKLWLLDGSKAGSPDVFLKLINLCNSEVSKAVISQTMTTENKEGTGSNAMAQVHQDTLLNIQNQDKRMVENEINKMFRWITDKNWGHHIAPPKFELYFEEGLKLDLAERDEKLKTQGVSFTKQYYIENYGFSDSDFDIVENTAPSPMGFSSDKEHKTIEPNEDEQLYKEHDKIVEQVVKLIEEGKSFDDIEKKLIEFMGDVDTSKVEDLMAQGIFASMVGGQIDSQVTS